MRIRYWLTAAAVTFVLPPAASAQEAVEAAIRGWVASIDATPDWAASYGSLSYDPATDVAAVTDLVITAEPGNARAAGTSVSFGRLAVAGYVEGPDGFTARSVTVDRGAIETEFMDIRLADIALDELSAPYFLGFTFDDQKPFTSIIAAYRQTLDIGLHEGRIGTVALDQVHEGVTSTVVYEDFLIQDMASGKVAVFDTGPVRMDSPSPNGLVRMAMGGIESRDTDLAAFVHVYDPGSYANGTGDMVWRNAIAYAAYNDVTMDVPGMTLNIGSVQVEDFRLRQPPESFASFFDEIIAHPNMPDALAQRLAARAVPAMLSSFSMGRFAILDTSVDAMGIDHLVVRDFHLDDLSIDGLGELGVEGIESVVQGQGAVELNRFAFGGITFGGYEALSELLAASMASPPADVSHLAPRLGFVELAGLDLQTPDIPRLSLERFRADASDYVGFVPTTVAATMTGLSLPVSAITDTGARDMLRGLGYERIVSEFGLAARYDQAAERVDLDDLHYGIDDMGSFAMSGAVSGLPLEALTDERLLETLTPGLRLEAARFAFKDDSIVGKGLDILAGYMNAPPGAFRDQFADAMPFLLSIAVQNDPQLLAIVNKSGLFKQLTPVVRDFVANPGSSIIVSLAPPSPVAIDAISTAVESTPERVVELLGLTISGERGALSPPGSGTPPPDGPVGGNDGMTPSTPGAEPQDGGSTPASRDGADPAAEVP